MRYYILRLLSLTNSAVWVIINTLLSLHVSIKECIEKGKVKEVIRINKRKDKGIESINRSVQTAVEIVIRLEKQAGVLQRKEEFDAKTKIHKLNTKVQ